MLRTRVITAVAILVVLIGMLFFAPAIAWSLFTLAIALVACWEWSRLSGLGARAQPAFLFASGAVGASFWLLYARDPQGAFTSAASTAFILSAVFWIVAAPAWLAKKARPSAGLCAAAGWLVVWPTWFAFVVLRDASPWLLLAIAALVWVADIAAYFAGRRFGKRKLAPAISPGKTWEGVYGALAGVAVYGFALSWIAHGHDTPISAIFEDALGLPAIACMLVLVALSVVGDLLESWMKRGAGMKDSSALLPGHGGVLDRIDALTSTLPVAALALSLRAGIP
ncbi:MAG TPA: phosphatidate cytidylyltransferase [Usitatibacter sp.]